MSRRDHSRWNDEMLLGAIALGDERAFDELYRRHADFITSLCERRTRSAGEAAEASAGVFLAIWRRAESFDAARGSALSWMVGIAKHRVLDHHRAERRRAAVVQRLVGGWVVDGDDAIDRTIGGVDAQRWAVAVAREVDKLPVDQRHAVRLVIFEGLSSTQAAAALGTTPTAVRMRLSRARRSLLHLRPLLGTAA